MRHHPCGSWQSSAQVRCWSQTSPFPSGGTRPKCLTQQRRTEQRGERWVQRLNKVEWVRGGPGSPVPLTASSLQAYPSRCKAQPVGAPPVFLHHPSPLLLPPSEAPRHQPNRSPCSPCLFLAILHLLAKTTPFSDYPGSGNQSPHTHSMPSLATPLPMLCPSRAPLPWAPGQDSAIPAGIPVPWLTRHPSALSREFPSGGPSLAR